MKLPKPLTLEKCARELAKAQETMAALRSNTRLHFHRNWAQTREHVWNHHADYPRHREIGRAIARIRAIHKGDPWRMTKADYAALDAAAGTKVKRQSQMPERASSYLEWIGQIYGGRRRKYETIAQAEPKPQVNLGFAGCKPFYAPVEREFDPIRNWIERKADVEYWAELTRLVRMREYQDAWLWEDAA